MTWTRRRFQNEVGGHLARIGKATSSPKRLELLELLCQGSHTVEALATKTSMSVANTLPHLQALHAAHLVSAEKQGLHVFYRADEDVARFFYVFCTLAHSRIPEVEQVTRQFLDEHGALEQMDGQELLRRVRGGEVSVLDVRPEDEYRAAHIPGALSIPVAALKKGLVELPHGREIVAYSRGPYCVMAMEAVALLRRRGFRAHRMEHGILAWRARGWRVEKSAEAEA
jgi:rhodanese-related sulfurtransferase